MSTPRDQEIPDLRARIDRVDEELVQLLARRMKLVSEISTRKLASASRAILDASREAEINALWTRAAERHDLPLALARAVLHELLEHSRRLQQSHASGAHSGYRSWAARVGYQGEPEAYSDLAIQKLFSLAPGSRLERVGHPGFLALFDALEEGAIDCALVPVENTISGSIAETTGLLLNRRIVVLEEEVFRVDLALAAPPGATLDGLRRIHSHPAALAQCQRTLESLRGCHVEAHDDTAGAARAVSEAGDPTRGAICSRMAATRHGLVVLLGDVADHSESWTRFLLLARADDARLTPPELDPAEAKTTAAFTARHERGSLLACLAVFAAHGLNLTRIESRPQPGAPWEYQFLIEFDGHSADPQVAATLTSLSAHADHIRVLGCYRRSVGSRFLSPAPPAAAPAPLPPAVTQPAPPPAVGPATPAPPAKPAKGGKPLLHLRRPGRDRAGVRVRDVEIGGDRFVLVAGPCSVESREQIQESARVVARAGARILRGGAFKPRTSPYSFQGLGYEGLALLLEAGRANALPVVTEVLEADAVERVAESADMLQVGARNMQNFALLRALGRVDRPVLLKRGMAATIEDLLHAAEYILAGGNQRVVLYERGIRTFETATRYTLDVAAIPVLRERTHLPVIVDPSHPAGRRELVAPLALAAVAAGADGLIVETHPRPEEALSDREQALSPAEFEALVGSVRAVLAAQGRSL